MLSFGEDLPPLREGDSIDHPGPAYAGAWEDRLGDPPLDRFKRDVELGSDIFGRQSVREIHDRLGRRVH